MKYIAKVEIEFETDEDPVDQLHRVMQKTQWAGKLTGNFYAEHYHIIELPKETK